MREEKIAKICWNDQKWSKPSGTNGKSPSTNAQENRIGYGQEEWLLDKARTVNGYHYGFLQQMNLRTDRHVGQTYKIWLYTMKSKRKFLIGHIDNVVRIHKKVSEEIFDIYKSKGWDKTMILELEDAGLNSENFRNGPANLLFNVKFKIGDIKLEDDFPEISDKDKNITTTRYKLLDKVTDFKFIETKQKGIAGYSRKTISDIIVDPYHNKIQNKLSILLRKSGDYLNVTIEDAHVDVKATSKDGQVHFFEVKTDTPKNNIRLAFGQLLEYAFYPIHDKGEKLIIIGDEEPNQDVQKYIKHLRKKTRLNIFYRWINMDEDLLSSEL